MLNFNAMVKAEEEKWNKRLAAGWDFDPEYGWSAPDGTSESDWEHELGAPFPEEPGYMEFITARRK